MKFILVITLYVANAAPETTVYDLPMSRAQCASIGSSTAAGGTDEEPIGFECRPVMAAPAEAN